jgi:hypothetical protein
MRIKGRTTVNRELRRVLNTHASALAEVILQKALCGDSAAMLAATHLMIEANKADAVAVEEKELSDGGRKWLQSLVSADGSPEAMAAFKGDWNRRLAAHERLAKK